MSQPLEYHEAMGSLEEHEKIMLKRLEEARAELERAESKAGSGIGQKLVEKARQQVELRQQELNEFRDKYMSVGAETK